MTPKEAEKAKQILDELLKISTWTKVKHTKMTQVVDLVSSGRHKYFWSHAWTHGLGNVGEYYFESNTHRRRGNLMEYRGSKVLVVCVGHGSYLNREYLAAPIV